MSDYEMKNKCNVCDQHQLIEVGTIGDEPWYITVEEFAKNNIEAYPQIKAKEVLLAEAAKAYAIINTVDNRNIQLFHADESQKAALRKLDLLFKEYEALQ